MSLGEAAPSFGRWRLRPALTAAAALAVVACLLSPPGARGPIDVEVRSVLLDPTDPERTVVGPLRFRGGMRLVSSDARFGGLSDLEVSADGRELLAVSDCGRGFRATLEYDSDGRLAGLRDAGLLDLPGPGGRPLVRAEIDAEALARAGDGGLLVGFEGSFTRVWRYSDRPAFAGPPRPLPIPPLAGACGGNRGLEAIATLEAGQLLLVCEGGGLRPHSAPAWIGAGENWTARTYPLDGSEAGVGDVHRPTSAALLPDGDVVVLERRFPPLGARLRRITRADLAANGPLSPREVVVLDPPLNVDNFEGVAVRRDAAGRTLVYLLSDDNGCAKRPGVASPRRQRTLLLMFALEG